MTSENYLIAWACYLCGALILLWVWWQLTRSIRWRSVQVLLRTVVGVLLLFPFSIDQGYTEMAPGVLVWLLAFLFEGADSASRSGIPLLATLVVVCTLVVLADVGVQRRQQQKAADRQNKQAFDELVGISKSANKDV